MRAQRAGIGRLGQERAVLWCLGPALGRELRSAPPAPPLCSNLTGDVPQRVAGRSRFLGAAGTRAISKASPSSFGDGNGSQASVVFCLVSGGGQGGAVWWGIMPSGERRGPWSCLQLAAHRVGAGAAGWGSTWLTAAHWRRWRAVLAAAGCAAQGWSPLKVPLTCASSLLIPKADTRCRPGNRRAA